MPRTAAISSLALLLVALVFGVAGAVARPLAGATIVVNVTGVGNVHGPSGSAINCGNGSTSCYAVPATGSSLVLSATATSGWTFSDWAISSDDCPGMTTTTCTVDLDTAGTHL